MQCKQAGGLAKERPCIQAWLPVDAIPGYLCGSSADVDV